MADVFLELFNMSITASWLVLAVMVLRFLLKKAPKSIICFLWLLVAIRLIFPISIESVLSLVPSTETISEESLYSDAPVIDSGISAINDRVNPVISESLASEAGASVNPMQVVTYVASIVWMAGMGCMLIYALISYFRLRFKVREGVEDENRIWLCDRISTPFILGVIRPRIFIPTSVEKDDMEYVIAHERAHLKRKDHWWKPLGFLLLTVYWFNPVMWLAYVLLCKDIEYACDEKVLNELGVDCRKAYSNALVNCSVSRKSVAVCPLAFGEVGVKGRIKSVLSYKKPAFWVITVALVACIVVVLAFLTNPITIKHYGRDITEEEFYENYEDCLKKLSVNEVPRFNFMTILEGEIRKLNLSREELNPVEAGYPKTLNNIITAAVMAFGATQYEEYPSDITVKNIRNRVLDGAIDYAFENGVFETYYEQIYIYIKIDSTGYKMNGSGFLEAVEGEKQYISWTLYMESRDTYFGNYYYNKFYSDSNTKTYRDVTPTLSIRLEKDYTFKMNRGTGMDGDIRGTYELERDRLILENIEAQERYIFELVDPFTIKYLAEESDPIRVFTGTGVEELENEIFEFEGEYNNSEMEKRSAELYYGDDVNGERPQSIVRQYYEYLEEEYNDKRSQWFTEEYLDMNENAEYQDMTLSDLEYCMIVDEKCFRESDYSWIDEIADKYSGYCFVQTEAKVICEEDGPSGMKGETVEQQYYFALVLAPEDGCWKIDDFGYPPFDIPLEEVPDATGYKVKKEGYELAYITGIDEGEGLKISVDYVDWISDYTQPNGFQIINPVDDNVVYSVDEDTEYQISQYFSEYYEGTLEESSDDTTCLTVSEESFIKYQKEYGFGLFWVKVENGIILQLVEQYVP